MPEADLRSALDALHRRDWRGVQAWLAADAGSTGYAAAAFSMLAAGMRRRAVGDLESCAKSLAGVTKILELQRNSQDLFAEIRFILDRETDDLERTRKRILNANPSKQAALVQACVDHLVWIEFDPWTWQSSTSGQERFGRGGWKAEACFGDVPTRNYFLWRASRIHQFAHLTRDDMTRRVWEDLGRYRGLRARALQQLAAASPAPNPGRYPAPVGPGVATEFARIWQKFADLDSGRPGL